MLKRPMFKPRWSEPCPCASGKKHKDCCWRRLPGFDIGKSYSAALNDKSLERALVAARADVTQYTIWHKSNTAPALEQGAPILGLLRIDVNALGDYVGRLSRLYYRLNLWDDWPVALDRLRENIRHPWWLKKLVYYRAVSHLAPGGDRAKARREFAKAGAIGSDEEDLDILHLYVDLEFDDQPFSSRIGVLDQILRLSNERHNLLQYRGAKAVQYFMIGDRAEADRQLSEIVETVRESESEDPLDLYERHLFARLIQLQGSIRSDKGLLKEAVNYFSALLLEEDWTASGKAALHREVGDCHKYAADWDAAEREYRDAIALDGAGIDKIHLAECLLYRKEILAASKEIDAVDRASLGRHEFEDFVFAFAAIAIWSNTGERLKEAKNLLEELKTVEPLFNERRLKLLVGVTETIANGKASSDAKLDSTPDGGLAVASRFFLLEPNIAGIGINFNAIIEYFAKKKLKKQE